MSTISVSTSAQLVNALVSALSGDTIILLPGTYLPTFNDPNRMAFQINKPGLRLISPIKGAAILNGNKACHSVIELQANSAGVELIGLACINSANAALWANSGGAQAVRIAGCELAYCNTPTGGGGMYADAASDLLIEDCYIHDNGRTADAGNSFDHGIYTHGRVVIRRNTFSNSLSGWHIQTADGFSGIIEDNTFLGPNGYDAKPGQIMLWGACGPIMVRNNRFINSRATVLVDYAFSGIVLVDGYIIEGAGVPLGAPAGAIVRK